MEKNTDRFITPASGNAFLLTEEGKAHAPAGKEREYAVGYPIRGYEYKMDRSFIEKGWVREGPDPKIDWPSPQQTKYVYHIHEVTGNDLPDFLTKEAAHQYISANQAQARQIDETQKIRQAEHMAKALGISQKEIGGPAGAGSFVSAHMSEYRKWERNEIVARVSINSYLDSLGYEIKQVGRWHTVVGMDSIRITNGDGPNGLWVRNSDSSKQTGGSVVDLCMYLQNKSYAEAIEELRDFAGGLEGPSVAATVTASHKADEQQERTLKLSDHPQAGNMKNVFAYLIKTRKIDSGIVSEMVQRKMLYQDTKANCVFVSYDDEKANFACLRGTNTNPGKKFVADVSGCDYTKGWYVKNGSDRLVVCEAPIDAMSVMAALKRTGIDYKDYDYLSISGVAKMDSLYGRLKDSKITEVYLAFDNDTAGRNAIEQGKQVALRASPNVKVVESLPKTKDWNTELAAAGENGWIDTSSFADRFIQETNAKNMQQSQEAQKNRQRQRQEFGMSL